MLNSTGKPVTNTTKAEGFKNVFGSVFTGSAGTRVTSSSSYNIHVDPPQVEGGLVYPLLQGRHHKSMGLGRTQPRVGREGADFVARPLSVTLEKLWRSGGAPGNWTRVNVKPSRGLRSCWPVSLTSVPGKAMDQVLLETTTNQIKQVIGRIQHGFTKGKSCQTYMIMFYNKITFSVSGGAHSRCRLPGFQQSVWQFPGALSWTNWQNTDWLGDELGNWPPGSTQSVVVNSFGVFFTQWWDQQRRPCEMALSSDVSTSPPGLVSPLGEGAFSPIIQKILNSSTVTSSSSTVLKGGVAGENFFVYWG